MQNGTGKGSPFPGQALPQGKIRTDAEGKASIQFYTNDLLGYHTPAGLQQSRAYSCQGFLPVNPVAVTGIAAAIASIPPYGSAASGACHLRRVWPATNSDKGTCCRGCHGYE